MNICKHTENWWQAMLLKRINMLFKCVSKGPIAFWFMFFLCFSLFLSHGVCPYMHTEHSFNYSLFIMCHSCISRAFLEKACLYLRICLSQSSECSDRLSVVICFKQDSICLWIEETQLISVFVFYLACNKNKLLCRLVQGC